MERMTGQQNIKAPVVIRAEDIHKKFKVFFDKGTSLKEKAINFKRNKHEDRWVLNGIDLTVHKGEAVGLIGENGCGKSTMLKMLTRIMYPDRGSIEITGRVSSLIELGAGFHPDLSGRENIYTNASIFGLSKSDIHARMEDICEFSELGDYLDNPVRTYSSGMYMRLAFSIAINVDADVLLIDEILAVGDANFQTKCFQKLREIKSKGVTIVIVSHDLGTIQSFCDNAMWLCDGKAASYGNAKNVVEDYRQYMNQKYKDSLAKSVAAETEKDSAKEEDTEISQVETKPDGEMDTSQNRFGLRYIEITDVIFRDESGKPISAFSGGTSADIDIHYHIHKPTPAYNFGMGFYSADGVCIYGVNTQIDGLKVVLSGRDGFIRFHMDEIPLLTGRYYFQVAVDDEDSVPLDYIRRYRDFEVISEKMAIGLCDIKHEWFVCDE